MLRSVLAVLAGFATWTVLWLISNQLLMISARDQFHDDGTTDHAGLLAVILIASVVISIAAGWLTAKIAPTNPFGHALALGALLLAVGVGVQWQYWHVMPLWYHLSFLALLLPASILGGGCFARGK
jgi:hypothetical protein